MMKRIIDYIVVDDENSAIEDLKNEMSLMTIDGVSFQCVKSFENTEDFLKAVHDIKFQDILLFLDYQMPGNNGVELAKFIDDKSANIIFVSGKEPSAAEIYECEAIDFVPKPVRAFRLKKTLKKALKQLIQNEGVKSKVCLNSSSLYRSEYNIEEIVMIEADGKKQTLYFEDKKPVELRCASLKKMAEEFVGTPCIQVSKKHIVNTDKVSKMLTRDSILVYYTTEDGNGKEHEVSIGDAFEDDFFTAKPHFRK